MITQIETTGYTLRSAPAVTVTVAQPRGWLARLAWQLRSRLAARRSAAELARLGDSLRADVGLPPRRGHSIAELRFIPRPEHLLTRSRRMTTGSGWFGGYHG